MIARYSMSAAIAAALGLCVLIAAGGAARANLVTDPGFESCTGGQIPPPDWSGTAGCSPAIVHSGSFAAAFDSRQTLSQSITTNAGASYDFSFWFDPDLRLPGDYSFTAAFGADVVADITNAPPSTYTFYDFTVTAAAASTAISFAAGPFNNGPVFLDDVSVTPVAAPVPEPATLPLLGGALGLLLFTRRMHRRCGSPTQAISSACQ